MKRISIPFTLVLMLLTLFTSCKEDTDEIIVFGEEENDSFYDLEVGNKWSYQHYSLSPDGTIRDTVAFEVVEVVEKITINDKQFARIKISTEIVDGNSCATCEENPLVFENVRDSLGFLISDNGTLLYSSDNNNPYLYSENPWGTVFIQLQQNTSFVEVPAGSFTTLNNMWYAIDYEGNEYEGRVYDYYSKGIGQIKFTMNGTIQNNPAYKKELIEYQLSSE